MRLTPDALPPKGWATLPVPPRRRVAALFDLALVCGIRKVLGKEWGRLREGIQRRLEVHSLRGGEEVGKEGEGDEAGEDLHPD